MPRQLKARLAGSDGDPLSGIGPAGRDIPAPTTAAPPPMPEPLAPITPTGEISVSRGEGEGRRNPGRLIGGRADANLAARFDELQQSLQIRLSNPRLSVNEIMLAVLERTIRESEDSIDPLALEIQGRLQAKVGQT